MAIARHQMHITDWLISKAGISIDSEQLFEKLQDGILLHALQCAASGDDAELNKRSDLETEAVEISGARMSPGELEKWNSRVRIEQFLVYVLKAT